MHVAAWVDDLLFILSTLERALGRAADPELDVVHQLRVWMEALDLRVHPRCRKGREPAARCPLCPPLFPRTRRSRGNVTISDGYACSPQRMS